MPERPGNRIVGSAHIPLTASHSANGSPAGCSSDAGLSGYHAAIRHLPRVENLRRKSLSGEEFDYLLKIKKEL